VSYDLVLCKASVNTSLCNDESADGKTVQSYMKMKTVDAQEKAWGMLRLMETVCMTR